MTQPSSDELAGRHILVVEDEYLIAQETARTLNGFGAVVVGPAGSIERAHAFIESDGRLDGAVLDLNLRGQMAYPIADALRRRAVPFLFTTGYDEDVVLEAYSDVPRCEKPVEPGELQRALSRLLSDPARDV